ncbi:MAG: peptidoglycan-associated lipoprotein Pal [Nitrospirae bacterium]|nr:MAG: peptidoglycan-associated lipoprotein Pal [Nitrospirota bacterium]
MHTCTRTVTMVGLLGLVALVGAGCSKSIQSDVGSKSFEPAPSQSKSAGQDAPVSQFGSLPGDSNGKSSGKGSGEERVSEGVAVAKAESSGSSRQQEMQQEAAATAEAGLDDVFFAYDSWKLSEDGKQALSKDAEWLKTNGSQKLAVEGHCDERGTQAYNLVLGQKRAKAVRNYLVELGVAGNRITIVSYGKDRPFCKESNESCYQRNRRGHLVVSGK